MRFGRLARLHGAEGMQRLLRASVCVVGVGGVGSWTAEALARSAIGQITLVDPDVVCISNFNRQLPALEGQVGRPKAEVMAARLQAINPACRVQALIARFSETTAEACLGRL